MGKDYQIKAKAEERERIRLQTEAFLAAGGKPYEADAGESAVAKRDLPPPKEKRCNDCRKIKPIDSFYSHSLIRKSRICSTCDIKRKNDAQGRLASFNKKTN